MVSMSTPTDPSSDDELRALRARAYGPLADIHDDPVALARLQELESQQRNAAAPVVDEPSPLALFEEAPDAGTAPPPAAEAGAPDPVPGYGAPDAPGTPEDGIPSPDMAADEPERGARPWWRRTRVLWAASLVAAVLFGVGLTLSVQSVTAGKVATLGVDEDAEWPSSFGDRPPGGQQFDDFHGMSVLSYPQGFSGDPSQICLYALSNADGNGTVGAAGCGSGAFPASAALTVSEQLPRELREAFPVGTALQFVLDGEQVHVYAKAPGVGEPTPTPTP